VSVAAIGTNHSGHAAVIELSFSFAQPQFCAQDRTRLIRNGTRAGDYDFDTATALSVNPFTSTRYPNAAS
jgi:hypothetical protein